MWKYLNLVTVHYLLYSIIFLSPLLAYYYRHSGSVARWYRFQWCPFVGVFVDMIIIKPLEMSSWWNIYGSHTCSKAQASLKMAVFRCTAARGCWFNVSDSFVFVVVTDDILNSFLWWWRWWCWLVDDDAGSWTATSWRVSATWRCEIWTTWKFCE